MATEPLHAPSSADRTTPAIDWHRRVMPDVAATPIDESLLQLATEMAPGKALHLGCGDGGASIWLAQRGWVVNGVDASAEAIDEARAAAAAAGVTMVLTAANLSDWKPVSRYDLVFCTFALPARGMGRSRMLETAAEAVALGGTILLTDLDISLRRDGWMAEKYLVSTEELERHLDGFRISRSAVRMARHRHGYQERVLPVATVIATRRPDLRVL
jgi:trans-aconitate methyltransferase